MLVVEEEGVEYGRNRQGGPILPAFRTAEPSHDLLDAVYTRLREGELCMTNGPVFSDYDTSGGAGVFIEEPEEGEAVPLSAKSKIGTWTLADGRTMEAEFMSLIGTKTVLKNPEGRIKKVLFEQFSAEDRTYIELVDPPAFNINFSRKDRQRIYSGRSPRASENRGSYGVRFKQIGTGAYNHELQAEIFVSGQQKSKLTGKYILIDRQQTVFTATRENQRSHEYYSDKEVVLTGGIRTGVDYQGYLVTLTDVRGERITVETSHQWLADGLDNLKELKVETISTRRTVSAASPPDPKNQEPTEGGCSRLDFPTRLESVSCLL